MAQVTSDPPRARVFDTMEPLQVSEGQSAMFEMAIPWWEFIVRSAAVYIFLVLILRISGKRQIGQLAPFDLVLLLVLANAVQNSMTGGDNSLIGGLISCTTLVALNYVVGYTTFKSSNLEEIIEGRPQVLIHKGKVLEDIMCDTKVTLNELKAALRQGGCPEVSDCHSAILENNGVISVVKKKDV
jgi:uncharacterized membrane protein YcaP (DUF421 family)